MKTNCLRVKTEKEKEKEKFQVCDSKSGKIKKGKCPWTAAAAGGEQRFGRAGEPGWLDPQLILITLPSFPPIAQDG